MERLSYSMMNWLAKNLLNDGCLGNLDYAYTGCNTKNRRLRRFTRIARVINDLPNLTWQQREKWLELNSQRAFEKCYRSHCFHHNKRKKTTKCQCYRCVGRWKGEVESILLTRPPLSKDLDDYLDGLKEEASRRDLERYHADMRAQGLE